MKAFVGIIIVLLIGIAVFFMLPGNTPQMMPSPMGMSTSTMATSTEMGSATTSPTTEIPEELVYTGSVMQAGGIDVSKWMEYRNEKVGFVVRYPKDWRVKESESTRHSTVTVFFGPKGLMGDSLFTLTGGPDAKEQNEEISNIVATFSKGKAYNSHNTFTHHGLTVLRIVLTNDIKIDPGVYRYNFFAPGYSFSFDRSPMPGSVNDIITTQEGYKTSQVFEAIFDSFRLIR